MAAMPPASSSWLVRLLRTRWLVRAPIWLWRARLGFLLGSRLLLLEHIGRRSGARRYVALEVVGRPAADHYLVVSGFGDRAQWLRNVRVHSGVRVSVGRRNRVPAQARLLAPEEVAEHLSEYAKRHPRAWRTFEALLRDSAGAFPPEVPLANHVRMLELHLLPRRTERDEGS